MPEPTTIALAGLGAAALLLFRRKEPKTIEDLCGAPRGDFKRFIQEQNAKDLAEQDNRHKRILAAMKLKNQKENKP